MNWARLAGTADFFRRRVIESEASQTAAEGWKPGVPLS